ncbi:hypothetical protein [Escherichia coli]|uniref:hypothetical protein n=1 Tax=Escherichia coli TaxID=562 RepID=UPI002FCCCEB8
MEDIKKGLKQLDEQAVNWGTTRLIPVYGSCRKNEQPSYRITGLTLSGMTGSFWSVQEISLKNIVWIVLIRLFFGKEQIESRKGLVILDLTIRLSLAPAMQGLFLWS